MQQLCKILDQKEGLPNFYHDNKTSGIVVLQ